MPANPSDVTVTTDAAVVRDFQIGVPVIIGYDSSYSTADEPKRYSQPAAVSAAHGAATKTTKAALAMMKNGARSVIIVKPKITTVAGEDAGAVSTGTLENFPIHTATAPTVEVDSVAKTVVYTLEDPISGSPAAGEVWINPYTGDFKSGAAPSTGIVFDYSYIDYTSLVDGLNSVKHLYGPYTFFMFPGLPISKANYGDFKKLADTAKDETWFVIGHFANGTTVADAKALREKIENQHALGFAHKDSTSDGAAIIVGIATRTDPWVTLAYKRTKGFDTTYYLKSEIGDVETADTFEGEGINVLHRIGTSDALTNERTLVSYTNADTAEYYASRILTRIYLQRRTESRLTTLVTEHDRLSYDEKGIGSVVSALTEVMEDLVQRGAITRDYAITPPVLADISAAVKKARKLGPFEISAKMVESAHEITVNASLEVAA